MLGLSGYVSTFISIYSHPGIRCNKTYVNIYIYAKYTGLAVLPLVPSILRPHRRQEQHQGSVVPAPVGNGTVNV